MTEGKNNPGNPGKKTHLALIPALGTLLFLACSGGTGEQRRLAGDQRLETITSFSLALSKREYLKAIGYLSEPERTQITGPDGAVSEDMKSRLSALQLSTLYRNPAVLVSHGKISGIAAMLPVLDQAAAAESMSVPETETAIPPGYQAGIPASNPNRDELHRTARIFFRSVKARQWKTALGYVDENERSVFMQKDGKLRTGTRRRLVAIDTASWDALTLKDGKLTGVVMIVPALSQVAGP